MDDAVGSAFAQRETGEEREREMRGGGGGGNGKGSCQRGGDGLGLVLGWEHVLSVLVPY